MNGVNKAIILGTVVRDPETKASQSGTTICNLTIVTNYKVKGEENPEFHRVVLFNRQAELADQYLKKGSQVYIEGRIQTRSWEKDGVKRYSTEVIANQLQFLGGRGDSGDRPSTERTEPQRGNTTAGDGFIDPIPFAPLDWRV